MPTTVLGGKKNAKKIVDEASASLPGIDPLSIEAPHTDMCKFESEFRSGFISISGKLSDWIKGLETTKGDEDSNIT
ncbi:hypothetical protein B0T25DRAFT_582447 [Lasiosphaeria hispida]|uniref:Uncharacterized protein n=1 Tax=Lasiosphaeria hispida TaxID=260671 RepID=A0AAJ0MCE1_9PEZI|nr:hypothetical protein B0T25DRAFT_582447 [Lasiosphaeria hispida]